MSDRAHHVAPPTLVEIPPSVFRFSLDRVAHLGDGETAGSEPRRIQVDPALPLLAAAEPDRADSLDQLEACLGDVLDLLGRIWSSSRRRRAGPGPCPCPRCAATGGLSGGPSG